jgi:hypothetical protein
LRGIQLPEKYKQNFDVVSFCIPHLRHFNPTQLDAQYSYAKLAYWNLVKNIVITWLCQFGQKSIEKFDEALKTW